MLNRWVFVRFMHCSSPDIRVSSRSLSGSQFRGLRTRADQSSITGCWWVGTADPIRDLLAAAAVVMLGNTSMCMRLVEHPDQTPVLNIGDGIVDAHGAARPAAQDAGVLTR